MKNFFIDQVDSSSIYFTNQNLKFYFMEDKFMFINNSQNNVHFTNGTSFVQFPPNQPISNQGSKIVQISPSVPEEEPSFKSIND